MRLRFPRLPKRRPVKPTAPDPRTLGERGEEVACEALKGKGYRILERNFTCPLGEIDLVARRGSILIFVEVKSETGDARVLAKERVDKRKQRKLLQVAQFFMKQKKLQDVSARFDVVHVIFHEGLPPMVDIIPNAFEAESP